MLYVSSISLENNERVLLLPRLMVFKRLCVKASSVVPWAYRVHLTLPAGSSVLCCFPYGTWGLMRSLLLYGRIHVCIICF